LPLKGWVKRRARVVVSDFDEELLSAVSPDADVRGVRGDPALYVFACGFNVAAVLPVPFLRFTPCVLSLGSVAPEFGVFPLMVVSCLVEICSFVLEVGSLRLEGFG
jgi:hypothetical protein